MAKAKEKPGWALAPEVESIAENLIGKYHHHLSDQHIVYLFNRKQETVRGAGALATASKVTGRNSATFMTTLDDRGFRAPSPFFLISVWKAGWDELSDAQKVALVDHELCHCVVNVDEDSGEESLGIKPHDLEEFKAVVQRHGYWRPDVQEFVEEARSGQRRLFEADKTDTENRFADLATD